MYLAAGVGLWIIGAGLFILRSPGGAFTHDFRGHVEHTRILYNEKRLALPREGWETYQPPLYYGVNSLFSPNHASHVFRVRFMSVLYGSLMLLLMSGMLTRWKIPPLAQGVVLFFIATTPAFLFLFTTYNNDSLATLLSAALLAAAYEAVREGRRGMIPMLGLLATAGLYTKLTVAFPLAALGLVLGFLGCTRVIPWSRLWPVFLALCVSVLLLTPWLIGHNYRLTGQFTPVPADTPLDEAIRLPASPLRVLLTPPGWTPGEWQDPYARHWEKTHHKKNSFLAYFFTTSVFGEYTFTFLPPIIPWAILSIQGLIWGSALIRTKQSAYAVLSLSMIVLGALGMASLIFRVPYATQMDFRYVAWIWLPGALLYATSLLIPATAQRAFPLPRVFRALMIAGTLLQGLLWLALIVGGSWTLFS